MSKKSLIINIICLLAIIPFSVIIQDLNIFKTILTLSITIIFISSFHHLSISQNINIQNNYNDKCNYYLHEDYVTITNRLII